MRKYLILLIIFSFFAVSCTQITEHNDEMGTIIGTLTDLGNGQYGVDGIARPVGKLFYSDLNVKYIIHESCMSIVLEHNKVGEQIDYNFSYVEVKEGDWNTVISVYN